MKPTTHPQSFALDFGDGTRITARLNLSEIASAGSDKLPSVVEFFWDGPKKTRHWPRYLPWVRTVWQFVADHTGKSILSVMRHPNGSPFTISFKPHCPPQMSPLLRR